MKKILAIALAVLMLAALAVPAFAVDDVTIKQDSTLEGGAKVTGTVTPVTYGVKQTYTITLPSAIEFGYDTTATSSITAKEVVITGNLSLQIYVASDNNFKMVADGCDAVPYVMSAKVGDTTTEFKTDNHSAVVLEVAASKEAAKAAEGTAELTFTTPGTSQAGDYEDNLTFTIEIDTPTANS